MNDLVNVINGELKTTTLAIAEGVGNQHKNVLELIRNHLADFEEFGRVAFETRPFETAGGIQNREVALLNQEQATLLMTYMRNSEVVREFKKRLVKAFFDLARSQASGSTENTQKVISANDVFKSSLEVANLIFKGNQAILSANKATLRHTGVDVLESMGVTELIADKKQALLTPSDIGSQIGETAQTVNKLLTAYGLQTNHRDAKNKLYYEPTEKGDEFGEMVDTDKKHKSGEAIKRLKWYSSIVDELKSLMGEEVA